MASKKIYGKKKKEQLNKNTIKRRNKKSIWGFGFLVLGLFILLTIFKSAGVAGDFIFSILSGLFGFGYYLLPIVLGAAGVAFVRRGEVKVARRHSITGFISLLSALGIADIAVNGAGHSINIVWGGYLGSLVALPFIKLLEFTLVFFY